MLQLDRPAEARAVLQQGQTALNQSPLLRFVVGILKKLASGTRDTELTMLIRRVVDMVTAIEFDPEALFGIATLCARAGQPDHAMALIDPAVTHGFVGCPIMQRQTWLDPLRRRADFRRLLTLSERRRAEAREAQVIAKDRTALKADASTPVAVPIRIGSAAARRAWIIWTRKDCNVSRRQSCCPCQSTMRPPSHRRIVSGRIRAYSGLSK